MYEPCSRMHIIPNNCLEWSTKSRHRYAVFHLPQCTHFARPIFLNIFFESCRYWFWCCWFDRFGYDIPRVWSCTVRIVLCDLDFHAGIMRRIIEGMTCAGGWIYVRVYCMYQLEAVDYHSHRYIHSYEKIIYDHRCVTCRLPHNTILMISGR